MGQGPQGWTQRRHRGENTALLRRGTSPHRRETARPSRAAPAAAASATQAVTLHDGSVIHLQKAADGVKTDDRNAALMRMQQARDEGNILTGLMFLDPNQADLTQVLNLATTPLNELGKDELCPGSKVLKSINEGLR